MCFVWCRELELASLGKNYEHIFMRIACLLLIWAAVLVAPKAALASGGELWAILTAIICQAQDSTHDTTPVGTAMSASVFVKEMRQEFGDEALRCWRQKQLLPREMCKDVLNDRNVERWISVNELDKRELYKLEQKHQVHLGGLARAYDACKKKK